MVNVFCSSFLLLLTTIGVCVSTVSVDAMIVPGVQFTSEVADEIGLEHELNYDFGCLSRSTLCSTFMLVGARDERCR